ncbi:MAG: M20/M25/M40 family metallo-hydrolase [Actinobacteria bacterium]|nr:MAG: M20/M25/M40 family metallo-hydrolase [Actinomycetota bacterium]
MFAVTRRAAASTATASVKVPPTSIPTRTLTTGSVVASRSVSLSQRERAVCDSIAGRGGELVELASALIGFDTTARNPDDPPRQEAELQSSLADRLRAAGATVDVWEPSREETEGRPLVPPGLGFEGRPQLVARFGGSGNGRSLLFNGHIDAVSTEPVDRWTSDPFHAEVRDGLLYGRGSCDMKGGVAAMVFACEILAEAGVSLAGDLVVATNTDEEWYSCWSALSKNVFASS